LWVTTVLRLAGVRVVVHTNDHPPPHVHCFVGDGEVLVLLAPEVRERERRGRVPAQEARRVLALVRANRGFLLAEWRRHYP
jgi:hypothetical protein